MQPYCLSCFFFFNNYFNCKTKLKNANYFSPVKMFTIIMAINIIGNAEQLFKKEKQEKYTTVTKRVKKGYPN